MDQSLHDFFIKNQLPVFEPAFDQGWQKVPGETHLTYIADQKPLENGHILKILVARNWRTSEKFIWKNLETLDPERQGELNAAISELQAKQIEEKRILNEQTAKLCAAQWNAALPLNGHLPEYLKTKGLIQTYGARLDPECADTILVPMHDLDGKLWGIQRIFYSGEKFFTAGQKGSGICHMIGDLKTTEIAYLCEGFATGASIYEATQKPVVIAFMAHNLVVLAEQLARKYPDKKIFVCADNDAHLDVNVGVLKATQAAGILNSVVLTPKFKEPRGRQTTDFNDLMLDEGMEAVRACLSHKASHLRLEITDPITPLLLTTKKGQPRPPNQQETALYLAKLYGDRIIKQNKDIFLYDGKIWKEIGIQGRHILMTQLQKVAGGVGTNTFLKNAFEIFLYNIRHVPQGTSLYDPHPFCINLNNGTIHLIRQPDHKYRIEFREHRKEDYLINLLPFDYDEQRQARNLEFEAMLSRLFEGDKDASDKITAIQQMYGACLLSAFPHFFFLVGAPGTGKSTIIQLASQLVSRENWCSVEPHEFKGFNMESMAGKLLNFETDVSIDKPIADSAMKKILDRRPIRVNRKFKEDIHALLPAVHIFGGNAIPPTLEGAYKAHDRRWTFIEFNNVQTHGQYDKEYHLYCYNQSPQGMFNWALQGLTDLLERRGHYLNPESGKKLMAEWQEETDYVGQFLKDIEEFKTKDIYRVKPVEGAKIERNDMHDFFKEWWQNTQTRYCPFNRNFFYKMLRIKGISENKINGVWYFKGYDCVRKEAQVP